MSGSAMSNGNTIGWSNLNPSFGQGSGQGFNQWWSNMMMWAANQNAHHWNSSNSNIGWAPGSGSNWQNDWNSWDPQLWQNNGQAFGNWNGQFMNYATRNFGNWNRSWGGNGIGSGSANNSSNTLSTFNIMNGRNGFMNNSGANRGDGSIFFTGPGSLNAIRLNTYSNFQMTNRNNINVNNQNSQNARSGNANNNGNTIGGSANSGSANNSNGVSTGVSVSN